MIFDILPHAYIYLTALFPLNVKFLKSHVDFHDAGAVEKMKIVLNSMDSERKKALK